MDALFALEPLDNFMTVCDEVLNHLYERDIKRELITRSSIISAAKEDIKNIFVECNFEIKDILAVLNNNDWNEEKKTYFLSVLDKRKTEILYETLVNYNSCFGETITNFDWLLKIVLGTCDLKTLRYPLLQLILNSTNADGEKKQIMYDVNKEMLEKIINVLENIDIKENTK